MKTDNELIEQFYVEQGGKPHLPEDISFYESDWNMLMPACKKWDELPDHPNPRKKSPQQELSDELDEIVALYEIAPVHKQLVRNIKWYNQNKA